MSRMQAAIVAIGTEQRRRELEQQDATRLAIIAGIVALALPILATIIWSI